MGSVVDKQPPNQKSFNRFYVNNKSTLEKVKKNVFVQRCINFFGSYAEYIRGRVWVLLWTSDGPRGDATNPTTWPRRCSTNSSIRSRRNKKEERIQIEPSRRKNSTSRTWRNSKDTTTWTRRNTKL